MSKDKLFSTIFSSVGIAGIANAAASIYNNSKNTAMKEQALKRHLDLMEEKLGKTSSRPRSQRPNCYFCKGKSADHCL